MTDKQHIPATVGDKAILPPLEDITKLGGYKGNTKRKADKTEHKEPKDGRYDKFTELSHGDDDEKHRQPLFKGDGYQGSATSDEWLNKDYVKSQLKVESFDIDMEAMKQLLESTVEDQEFVTQALDVFKATLQTKLDELQESVVERASDLVLEATLEMQETLSENYDAELEALEESVQEYLDAVVLEWAADNKLAIEESAQTAIAQSFMQDLAGLLDAYNIEVPTEKVDLYEASVAAGEQLYQEFEELQEAYSNLYESHQETNKILVTESFINDNDLTLSEAEQIRKLSSNLEFVDFESFQDKLNMIGESYINLQESRHSYNPYTDSALLEDEYVTEDEVDDYEHIDHHVAALMNAGKMF